MNLAVKKFLLWGISIIVILSSCNNHKRTYEGKVVLIDYSNVETIKNSSWIKIDKWKFIHLRSAKAARNYEFSLPATHVVFDSTESRSLGSQIGSHGMGLYIAKNLDRLNKLKLDSNAAKYTIVNPPLIYTHGILKVAKRDSSKITVEVPATYPAKIQVLE